MSSRNSASESHALRRPTDRGALLDFREVFTEMEPLAEGELDDFFEPSKLHVYLSDGVGAAESARLDVIWTTLHDYNIHYTDGLDRNLRWDVHPHDYPVPGDDGHFHPQPDASTDPEAVECSCIAVTEIPLVARAAHTLWRRVYEQGSFDGVNDAVDPP
ncbi:hypothetical protein [Halorussus litoreus]|uniref:hypothetical protein n=1 Tax=Halorussus litoreus TaxID=1710536 RepID=UPI000E267C3D|nr:hypothetical protein [Halorussus litoreus]